MSKGRRSPEVLAADNYLKTVQNLDYVILMKKGEIARFKSGCQSFPMTAEDAEMYIKQVYEEMLACIQRRKQIIDQIMNINDVECSKILYSIYVDHKSTTSNSISGYYSERQFFRLLSKGRKLFYKQYLKEG